MYFSSIFNFEGVCSCNSGYGGSDCFVETNLPPNVFGLANDGLCDTRDEECSTVVLYVNNTVNVPELSCYVTKLMVCKKITLI